jgi:hypothetical protein
MNARFWIAGSCAVVAAAVLFTTAEAAGRQAPPAKKAKTATTAETVAALHQAKLLLETAIHDYDGHRAKAVGEIHHAIRELAPNHKPAAKGTKKEGEPTTTPGETQAQSDAKLKQALEILNGIGGVANAKATGHLQTAVAELNTALKIK